MRLNVNLQLDFFIDFYKQHLKLDLTAAHNMYVIVCLFALFSFCLIWFVCLFVFFLFVCLFFCLFV